MLSAAFALIIVEGALSHNGNGEYCDYVKGGVGNFTVNDVPCDLQWDAIILLFVPAFVLPFLLGLAPVGFYGIWRILKWSAVQIRA